MFLRTDVYLIAEEWSGEFIGFQDIIGDDDSDYWKVPIYNHNYTSRKPDFRPANNDDDHTFVGAAHFKPDVEIVAFDGPMENIDNHILDHITSYEVLYE